MTDAPRSPNYSAPAQGKPTGLSIASMVLGIHSCVTFCFWWLAVPLGIIAVVLAVVARGKIARGEAGGAGMAKAGLITGVIGALLSILLTILAIAGLSIFGDKIKEEME